MATQLIKHLKNCAENDAIYSPLVYQWGFDEQLIAKALQNVSMYFPHYSRHDESHSRQILVHIERLLGENLTKLTATDTWLLLEAAYLHDIGMVVTDKQLTDNFEAIKKHAASMKYTASADSLIIIEALLASKGNSASAIFASVSLEAFQTLKLLREIIADYYRKKHPEQAGKIITHPLLEIGLDSPRNELLPARFFGLLSKICEYHGASFEKVMELPQQQVGMGTEDCHPRFVACLLRLGDLLDLDDNRFCPVMMKMAGDLPDLSKAHHQKHLAIRHFRADPDRIEIEAECPNYESYIETTKWFGWLRDEVKNQMSRWFDIVPARHFGLLPSVGDLKAHLKEWQVFSENQRPHFELDRDRIFELLQGAGLYECKEQAMRELLQNAVDATLIRIWREHGEDCQPQPESFIARDSAPPRYNNEQEKENKKLCEQEKENKKLCEQEKENKKLCDIFKRYAIDVIIEKIESEKKEEKEDEQYNYWRITIADQGTGISREDLKFMMQMGSSKKNSKRREIIEKMPVWMKPSGIFGIGLHSVFLLTNEVLIETRSIDTGETLVIRLTDPTDKKEHGNVYFQIVTEPKEIELANNKKQKFKPWNFSNFGCRLSFVYKSDNLKWQSGDIIDEALKNTDGLLVESMNDFHAMKIIKESYNFFDYSYLSGNLSFIDESQKLDINNNYLEDKSYYYSENEKLEITKINDFLTHHSISFNYRGQEIKDYSFSLNLLHVEINLLDDEADKLLSINRNKLKDDSIEKQKVFNRVSKAMQDFFKTSNGENFYKNHINQNTKIHIAAEYELQDWTKPNYFLNWNERDILVSQEIKKIKELEQFETIIAYASSGFGHDSIIDPDLMEDTNIAVISRDDTRVIYRLINIFLKNSGFKATCSLTKDKIDIVKFSKQNESVSKNVFIEYCRKTLLGNFPNTDFLKRRTIPCLKDFVLLALEKPNMLPSLKNESRGNWITPDFSLDLISPRMLFPLARIGDKITEGNLDILAKRVYKNRADKNTTEEQIKQKYQEFIAFLDDLMKDDEEWVKLRGDEFKPNLIADNKR